MSRYENGANLERRIVNTEIAKGNLSTRTPQSRGFFDVLIITKSRKHYAIQAKKKKLSPKERSDAINKFKPFAEVLKANKFVCLLLEHYDKKDNITDITKEVYQ